MKTYFHFALVLFLFAGIACGILAWVDMKTKPLINENKAKSENEARQTVLPTATNFEKKEIKIDNTDFVYYIAKDAKNQIVGYTFVAEGKGYSGVLKTMVGVDSSLAIQNILVIQQTETPGLGANSVKPDFPEKFKNLKIADLKVDKDGGKIKSLSGATITTRAITNSIKVYIELLGKALAQKAPADSTTVQAGGAV